MDGYAIRYVDRMDTLEIVGEMRAGRQARVTLTVGQAVRVFTGAPLPEGADTVVMQEKVFREDDKLTIKDDQLTIGMHVRQKGSEAQQGALALGAGHLLTPAAIGFLGGIGCQEVLVYDGPTVGIIVTGDELQELGKSLNFGQVYESNSLQLRAALQQAGVKQVQRYHAPDDPKKLEAVLTAALQDCDLILLVGGVSVGDYDFVVQTAVAQSVVPHFHRVKQKPGKPLFFGTKGKQLVFGLPGNPSSALTCFYLYVLPALDQMMQRSESLLTKTAITTADYYKNTGLTHFIKAYIDDEGRVLPLQAQESYRLQSYAHANCLLLLDEESQGVQAGEEVQIILLP
ncbi:Molybdopterin molybdenumtransferase [compost metagenome]